MQELEDGALVAGKGRCHSSTWPLIAIQLTRTRLKRCRVPLRRVGHRSSEEVKRVRSVARTCSSKWACSRRNAIWQGSARRSCSNSSMRRLRGLLSHDFGDDFICFRGRRVLQTLFFHVGYSDCSLRSFVSGRTAHGYQSRLAVSIGFNGLLLQNWGRIGPIR